jgi:type IV secretion system protein VirB4
LRKRHEEFLVGACTDLTNAVNGMLKTLKPLGAEKLAMVETKDGFYSRPLSFFAKIMNFSENLVPLPLRDISEYLSSQHIAFGFNVMEVRGNAGKYFGALFTIKEPQQIPAKELDKFLQLPQEFIITQTLDFINCKQALKEFKKQHEILHSSGAEDFAEAIGIDEIVNSDTGSNTDFGDSQLTILLIDPNLQKLEHNIFYATEALKGIGVVATRRDLRMEECFWAQLPGNFTHLSRRKHISTKRAAAFASLYNFSAGKRTGNLWGPAVSAFRTAGGAPYFFSFHVRDNGHTVLIGPHGAGKTVLMNFLVSESQKFHGKLFFFDQLRASKVFVKSIGGAYTIIKPLEKNPEYAFNPFGIEDTIRNRSFLKQWMIYLAEACGLKTSDAERAHIAKLVDYIYSLPQEQRRLSKFAGYFGGEGPFSLEKKMEPWHSGGEYSYIFDNAGDDVTSFSGLTYGFGMSFVLQNQAALGPVLSYLFHRVESSLDGTPAMIVIDEAWNLINNPIFATGIAGWLDRLRERNAMVVFASENIKDASSSELTGYIVNKIATQILLPNTKADDSHISYQEVWGLSQDEFKMLVSMNKDRRQFMLRQDDTSIVASLDLSGMKELDILSGSDKTVKIMDEVVAKVGDKPEDWIPAFYEKVREIRGELSGENEKLFIAQ